MQEGSISFDIQQQLLLSPLVLWTRNLHYKPQHCLKIASKHFINKVHFVLMVIYDLTGTSILEISCKIATFYSFPSNRQEHVNGWKQNGAISFLI